MKAMKLVVPILATLLMCGCGPPCSLFPLWDEDHLVTEPGLAGTWIAEDHEVLIVEDAGEGKYRIIYLDGREVGRYEAHAVRLGNRLFLDLGPDEAALQARLHKEVYQPLITAHFFARVDLGENFLRLGILDGEAVEELVNRGELILPLYRSDDHLILTAGTPELQQFVVSHAEDGVLWEDEVEFHRHRPQASGPNPEAHGSAAAENR